MISGTEFKGLYRALHICDRRLEHDLLESLGFTYIHCLLLVDEKIFTSKSIDLDIEETSRN